VQKGEERRDWRGAGSDERQSFDLAAKAVDSEGERRRGGRRGVLDVRPRADYLLDLIPPSHLLANEDEGSDSVALEGIKLKRPPSDPLVPSDQKHALLSDEG